MKRQYLSPAGDIILLSAQDLITASDSPDEGQPAVTDPNDWH